MTLQHVAPALAIDLGPSDNLQAVIDANPGDTTFDLKAGIYRDVGFVPKRGDRFLGPAEAILNGSLTLVGLWKRTDRGDFRYDGLPPALLASGKASADHPMAGHPQDLFVDGLLYERVATRGSLGSGRWFFDEAHHRAYAADDLNGRIVEISERQRAISGDASDVVLQGFTVLRYAVPAQFGAIDVRGDRWVLSGLTVRQNHGEGLSVFGKSVRVEGGSYSDNGQEGISGYRCDGLTITVAEIARNNTAGFNRDWQAGGVKVSTARGVTYANNTVHDNHGVGLWDDAEVVGADIRGNVVVDNDYNGIMDELSYGARIHDNRVIRNGRFYGTPVVPAGILLQNSSDAVVRGNYIVVRATTGNGITMTYEPRGVGSRGAYRTDHNNVYGNIVVFAGAAGTNGILAYSDRSTALAFRNIWSRNRYVVGDLSHAVFNDLGRLLTLAQAQARGLERDSIVVIGKRITSP